MDKREINHNWYESFDAKAMTLTVEVTNGYMSETLTVPAKFVVCEVCDGKGTHVNPSIDSHGISSEEFAEDPDFFEDYRSGVYDVACSSCGGLRVVPEVSDDASKDDQARIEKHLEDFFASEREQYIERQRGY